MDAKIFLIIFAATFAGSYGFGLREIWDYLLGGVYGQYPGYYPGNQGQGYYPGNQGPGYYPGNPGLYPSEPGYGQYGPSGPPGAHPGCPLCDSSVYSYCSHKQAHDACCCRGGGYQYNCPNNCRSLYANSCQEHYMITNCCCVDLQKNAAAGGAPIVAPVLV